MPDRPVRRIFISSPGDVVDERRRAAIVINRLAREFARFFDLVPVLWEYEPMLASGHFQDAIFRPSDSDVLVLILWSRLGTPLPERTGTREYRGVDGRAPVTGTEWEFEDALAHWERDGLPDLLVYRKDLPGRAEFEREDQLEAAGVQWRALRAFWERHFQTAGGSFKAAFNSFRDLDGFEALLERNLRQVLRQRLPPAAARDQGREITWTAGSPFRGLEPYEAEHAAIFFGREQAEREVTEALARNAEHGCAFLLVLGASGSGKSSLVRAGVLPALIVPGVATGVELWRRALFRPGGTAGDLFDRLAAAIVEQALPELPDAGIDAAALAQQMRSAPNQAALPLGVGLRAAERTDKSGMAGAPRLVLLVDQLEELFTLPEVTATEREGFVALLAALAGSGQVWIVATLRSDFYHRIDEAPGLRGLTAERKFDLAPPRPAELGEIVRGPAAATGLRYESDETSGLGLDAIIAEAAARDPAALPLLSFALDELYRRDIAEGGGDTLTVATYRSLGGLEGAIAERAEGVCAALPAAAVAAVMRELVTLHEGQDEASARPASRGEVATTPEREAVADALVAARLVVSAMSTGAGAAGAVLRLAHEALIRRWPRLAALIAGDRDFLRVRARLEEDRDRWERDKRSPDLLLPHGKRLAEGAELLAHRRADIDPATAEFIEASVARDRAQARRQLRRARLVAAALALLALTAFGFGWWGRQSSIEAARQRDIAQQQSRRAEQSIALATDTANSLVSDVAQKFRDAGVPVAAIKDILDRARTLQDQLAAGGDASPALRRSTAAALGETVVTLLALGDTTRALAAAQRAQALLQALVAASPDDTDDQRELAISDGRVGSVRAARYDLAGALGEYRAEIEIMQRLTQKDPGNTGWQRDLAAGDAGLGDVLAAQDDNAGALIEYRAVLDISRRLAAKDPGNADRQRDAAIGHLKVGDAVTEEGDIAAALGEYRQALDVLQKLADKDPGNAHWQTDIEGILGRIGNRLFTQSDFAGALAQYRAAFDIAQRLADKDPGNARWQQDLVFTYRKIGTALCEQNDLPGAFAAFDKAMAIARRLKEINPNAPESAKDFDKVQGLIVDALDVAAGDRRKAGDLAGAVTLSEAAVARARRAESGSDDAKRRLAAALEMLSWELTLENRPQDGLSTAEEALALDKSADWRPSAEIKRADALLLLGRFDEAEAIYLANKDRPFDKGKTTVDAIRTDFTEMRKFGIDVPDMKRVEALLAG